MRDKFLYEKIYTDIKTRILKGEFKEGDRLPSIRNLSSTMGISKNSVIYSFNLLELEGLIYAKDRSGYYVNSIDPLNKPISSPKNIKNKNKISKNTYDFSFSGVGKEYFDYKNLSKSFEEAILYGDNDFTCQNNPFGSMSLRKSISKYLDKAKNISADPSQIIISSSTYDFLNILNLLYPKNIFGFEDPSYFYKKNSIYKNIKNIGMDMNKGDFKIDSIDKRINIAVVMPSRQFPLTVFMESKRREELLSWAYEKDNRLIVENDFDAEFKYKLDRLEPLMKMDKKDKVIYIGNLSRTISPAIRISYMILPKSLLRKHKEKLEALRCPVSIIIQEAISNFMNMGYFDIQVNRSRVSYSKKYDYIYDRFRKEKNIKIISKDPGISFVIEIGNVDKDILLSSLKDKGINIKSVSDYSKSYSYYDKQYVLGFAKLSMEEIKKGSEIFVESVNKLIK